MYTTHAHTHPTTDNLLHIGAQYMLDKTDEKGGGGGVI